MKKSLEEHELITHVLDVIKKALHNLEEPGHTRERPDRVRRDEKQAGTSFLSKEKASQSAT
jgi:hypothetical protein